MFIGIFLIFIQPTPLEKCSCFQDSACLIGASTGILIGTNRNPNLDLTLLNPEAHKAIPRYVIGLLCVFFARLVLKAFFLLVLPPLFKKFPFLSVFSKNSQIEDQESFQTKLQNMKNRMFSPKLSKTTDHQTLEEYGSEDSSISASGSDSHSRSELSSPQGSKTADSPKPNNRMDSKFYKSQTLEDFERQVTQQIEDRALGTVKPDEKHKNFLLHPIPSIMRMDIHHITQTSVDIPCKFLCYAGMTWSLFELMPTLVIYLGLFY